MFTFNELSRPTDLQSISPGGQKGVKAVFELNILATGIASNGGMGSQPETIRLSQLKQDVHLV